jgi:hypothetical protein
VRFICDVTPVVDGVELVSKFVKRFELSTATEKDPSFEEVWKRLGNLVFGEYRDGHAKYLIELLEGPLFGLAMDWLIR